jgi:hypothetical protein
MPESAPANRRVVALALLGSAGILILTAVAAYTGLLPIGDDVRGIVAGVLGLAAALDLVAAFWFFRSSISS